MKTKSFLLSKTLWFNFLTVLVAVMTYWGWVPNQELMNQVSVSLVTAAPVVNMILRFWTDKGLSW